MEKTKIGYVFLCFLFISCLSVKNDASKKNSIFLYDKETLRLREDNDSQKEGDVTLIITPTLSDFFQLSNMPDSISRIKGNFIFYKEDEEWRFKNYSLYFYSTGRKSVFKQSSLYNNERINASLKEEIDLLISRMVFNIKGIDINKISLPILEYRNKEQSIHSQKPAD